MTNTYEQNKFIDMAEALAFQEQQEGTTSTVTVVETEEQEVPTLTLKLHKPRNDRKVQWSTETVDNENMNKKKSKCCCIYDKPRSFGESSSEDSEDECDHCHGHVDRKKTRKPGSDYSDGGGTSTTSVDSSSQTVAINNTNPE